MNVNTISASYSLWAGMDILWGRGYRRTGLRKVSDKTAVGINSNNNIYLL